MTLMNNAVKLALFAGMLGGMYLPQASADTSYITDSTGLNFIQGTGLGKTIDIPAFVTFGADNIGYETFTDTYTFKVSASAVLGAVADAHYSGVDSAGTTDFAATATENLLVAQGVQLTNIELKDATTGAIIQHVDATSSGPQPTNDITGNTQFSYEAYFTNANLLSTAHTYEFIVSGKGGYYNQGAPDQYSGDLSFASYHTTSVPEVEEWAMMLIGLSMMAWVVRRNMVMESNEIKVAA